MIVNSVVPISSPHNLALVLAPIVALDFKPIKRKQDVCNAKQEHIPLEVHQDANLALLVLSRLDLVVLNAFRARADTFPTPTGRIAKHAHQGPTHKVVDHLVPRAR